MRKFLATSIILLLVKSPVSAADREFRRDKSGNTNLLIFVHGFTGHYTDTWGQFPDLIINDNNLADYDVLMWGFPTKKLSRNPEINRIGGHLKTELDHLPERYQHIVIAAHSMGGLVVRAMVVSALMDGRRGDLTKIKQIVLYGTPNEGIDKADYVPKFVNRQVADMKTASAFIVDLRKRWLNHVYRADEFNDNYHLEIPTTVVVGLEDRFVPEISVSTFFRDYATTDGDHSSMVKPKSNDHLSLKILRKKMLESAPAYDTVLNEQDEALIKNTVSLLSQQLESKDEQLAIRDQQILELTKAVTALTQARQQPDAPDDIDEALASLSRGNTKKAESIFQSIADVGESEAKKAAKAYRHLGALAFLHDTQKALDAYRRSTELDPMNAEGWNNLGHLLDRTGDMEGAIKAYERLFELGDIENPISAVAYGNIGRIHFSRGELDKAEKFHLKALQINKSLGHEYGIAFEYSSLGKLNYTRGELDKAEEYYVKSLEINKTIGHGEGIADDYGYLAIVYQMRGNLDISEEIHLKSLEINEALERKDGIADQYGNLGILYQERGELDKAEEYYVNALEINKTLDRKAGIADQYGNIGNVYVMRGELDEAEEVYRKSLQINRALDRRKSIAANYSNLGGVYYRRGDQNKTRQLWEQSLSLYKLIGAEPMVQNVKSWLGLLD